MNDQGCQYAYLVTLTIKEQNRFILRMEGRFEDMILLRLIEAYCVPILSNGIGNEPYRK